MPGDKATYEAAKDASNGFEHGSMPLPQYRAAAEQHSRALLDYLRLGMLNLLDLPSEVRSRLADKRPIDTNAVWREIRGELHGAVQDPEQMGEGGAPYPFADWRTTLDDAQWTEAGKLRIMSRFNLDMRLGPGVLLTTTYVGIALGLNDADLFEFEPPSESAVVLRVGQSAAAAVADELET